MHLANEERELLFQFFGAYFHEDFVLEGKPQEIVERFIKDTAPDQRMAIGRAIVKYCDALPTDSELREKLFRELGCYYDPTADGMSEREWLLGVAARLIEHDS